MARANYSAGLVAGALAACAALGGADAFAEDRKSDIAELTKLSNAWDEAIVAKREPAIAGNMAEDFRIIDGRGNVENKAQFVAGVMDAKLVIDPYTVEDFEVRLYGDTALLSGRTRMTGKHDGQPFTSDYRYIDIYVRRAGGWKIVSVQITRLPQ
jgi:ketosteroid isomerase-like protein